MNLKILMSFQLFIQRLPSVHTVRYLFSKANLFFGSFLREFEVEQMCVWLQKSCSGACFSKGSGNISGLESCFVFAMFTFKIKVSIILKMIQLSVNEAKLTGLWARNCTTIQQVLILKFILRARKASGSFEKLAPGPEISSWWLLRLKGLKDDKDIRK